MASHRAAPQLEQEVKSEVGERMRTCPEVLGLFGWCPGVQGPLITNTVSWLSAPAELSLTCPFSLLLCCLLPEPWPFCGEEAGAVAPLWASSLLPISLTLSLLLLCCPALDLQYVRGLKDLLRTAALCLSRSGLGGARRPAPPPA